MKLSRSTSFLLAALGLAVTAPSLLTASPAAAATGSSLGTTILGPSSAQVGATAHYDVRVQNTGNQNTTVPWTVTIQLPETATSPTKYLLGTVSGLPTGCTRAIGKITCTYWTALKRTSGVNVKTIGFDLTLPYSTAPLAITATAAASNNLGTASTATRSLTQTYVTPLAPPAPMTVDHCTGRGLTSFAECVPGSLAHHSVTLTATGELDFSATTGASGYGGTWSVTGSQLTMTYTDGTTPVGVFVGRGVSATCWEGPMTFIPASPYVAMYRVCR